MWNVEETVWMSLLTDIHKALSLPDGCFQYSIVKGSYEYFHYGCDGHNDMVGSS